MSDSKVKKELLERYAGTKELNNFLGEHPDLKEFVDADKLHEYQEDLGRVISAVNESEKPSPEISQVDQMRKFGSMRAQDMSQYNNIARGQK